MRKKILVTVGPNSLNKEVVSQIDIENVFLFRINLSHTRLENVESIIEELKCYTDTPICLDSEGAQIRNQKMESDSVYLDCDDIVKIHYDEIIGDSNNISFYPNYIAKEFLIGDKISIDFDSAKIEIFEKNSTYSLAKVISCGKVGSNKAANLDRKIPLSPITEKDKNAIEIGKKWELNILPYHLQVHRMKLKR
jgi:pyruvate kinase